MNIIRFIGGCVIAMIVLAACFLSLVDSALGKETTTG